MTPSGHAVNNRMVEDSVWSVGQAIATLGGRYPRLTNQGEVDIHLRFQYRCYSNHYPPPNHFKPIPIQVLHHVTIITSSLPSPNIQGTYDMIVLAYFYLLCPG